MSEKILKATHDGDLKLGGMVIPAAVLEDGTRVLSRIGFLRAIGRKGKAKGGRKYDQEFKLPVFLTATNLTPFIPSELSENSSPIPYKPKSGGTALGYKAQLLPLTCNVFMDAKEAGVLAENQLHIADQCRILSRGLSLVGITALVDEATGYQEIRDKKALQDILDRYLLKELAAWAKRFPDEFYRQIFRLRGWEWRGMKINRPSVVGRYTNDLVYERLAPGILEELKRRMPKTESGEDKGRLHRLLTEDVGHVALQAHLLGLMALQRAAPDRGWAQFHRMVERSFPKFNVTIPLALED